MLIKALEYHLIVTTKNKKKSCYDIKTDAGGKHLRLKKKKKKKLRRINQKKEKKRLNKRKKREWNSINFI
jgi:hypothetical protein